MISEGYKRRLSELSGIIPENSIYGNNIIDNVTKKFGSNDPETLDKIAIFGLFRSQQPFNFIGDISKINNKDELDELFKEWYEKTVSDLIKNEKFIDNRELATKYLNAYVENIKTLKKDAKPFSLKDLEKTLIDVVNNNNWIKDENIKNQFKSIYDPYDEDIVYKNDNIIILKGSSKAKCVIYGAGKSWCITKPELNYFNTYRIQYGATIYFCLQPNVKGPEHTFVLLNYGKRGYAIADETNTGKRHGGPNLAKSWSIIESEIPNLKGLEKYFTYVEVNEDEKKYVEILSKKYHGDDLGSYIKSSIQGLVVNNSPVTTIDFIRDYVANVNDIDENQIKSLDDDMISSVIENGYQFNTRKFNLLSEKHQKRYIKLAAANGYLISAEVFEKFPYELKNLWLDKMIEKKYPIKYKDILRLLPKDLIDKYFNHRLEFGNGQFELSDNMEFLDESMIRKFFERGIELSRENKNKNNNPWYYQFQITDDVFPLLPEDLKQKTFEISVSDIGGGLSSNQYKLAPDDIKLKICKKRLQDGLALEDEFFNLLSDKSKKLIVDFKIEKAQNPNDIYKLSEKEFMYLTPEQQKKYISIRPIGDQEFDSLSDELKQMYVYRRALDDRGYTDKKSIETDQTGKKMESARFYNYLTAKQFEWAPEELKDFYLKKISSRIWILPEEIFKNIPEKIIKQYINGGPLVLNKKQFESMPDNLKKLYAKKMTDNFWGYYDKLFNLGNLNPGFKYAGFPWFIYTHAPDEFKDTFKSSGFKWDSAPDPFAHRKNKENLKENIKKDINLLREKIRKIINESVKY